MNKIEITVIIPIYNRGYCLDRCLDSVLNQTFQAWECWLIDDGSTDNTLAICEEYALKDTRFKVYHQSNQGVSVARNQGIAFANGSYLAFIDSDDWVEDMYLQKLYQAIQGAELVICGLTILPIKGNELAFSEELSFYTLNKRSASACIRLLEYGLLSSPVNKLYTKSIIEQKGLRFLPRLSLGEDIVFNFAYLSHIHQMQVIPDPLYHVVKQEYSLSSHRTETYFDSGIIVWKSLRDFFLSDRMRTLESEQYVGAYYCTTVANAIGGVQHLYDRLNIWQRFKYVQSILKRMDGTLIETYYGSMPNRWRAWLIRYEKTFLLWLFYELKYLQNKYKLK